MAGSTTARPDRSAADPPVPTPSQPACGSRRVDGCGVSHLAGSTRRRRRSTDRRRPPLLRHRRCRSAHHDRRDPRAVAGAGVPRTCRRRRRTDRGDRLGGAAEPGCRDPGRTAARQRSHRRVGRRADGVGRRRTVARAAPPAADVGPCRHRSARRGVAGLRRLPSTARRGARDRPFAGAERAAGGTARGRRGAAKAGAPATADGHVARGPNGDDGGDPGPGGGPPPADADRSRRGGQDPAARRDRSPFAGGPLGAPRGDVRAGGRQRGVRRRRRRRRPGHRPSRRRTAGRASGGGAGGDRGGAPPRQLRARSRPDRRPGRSSPGQLSERVDDRDQPRAAAGGGRAGVRGSSAADVR